MVAGGGGGGEDDGNRGGGGGAGGLRSNFLTIPSPMKTIVLQLRFKTIPSLLVVEVLEHVLLDLDLLIQEAIQVLELQLLHLVVVVVETD